MGSPQARATRTGYTCRAGRPASLKPGMSAERRNAGLPDSGRSVPPSRAHSRPTRRATPDPPLPRPDPLGECVGARRRREGEIRRETRSARIRRASPPASIPIGGRQSDPRPDVSIARPRPPRRRGRADPWQPRARDLSPPVECGRRWRWHRRRDPSPVECGRRRGDRARVGRRGRGGDRTRPDPLEPRDLDRPGTLAPPAGDEPRPPPRPLAFGNVGIIPRPGRLAPIRRETPRNQTPGYRRRPGASPASDPPDRGPQSRRRRPLAGELGGEDLDLAFRPPHPAGELNGRVLSRGGELAAGGLASLIEIAPPVLDDLPDLVPRPGDCRLRRRKLAPVPLAFRPGGRGRVDVAVPRRERTIGGSLGGPKLALRIGNHDLTRLARPFDPRLGRCRIELGSLDPIERLRLALAFRDPAPDAKRLGTLAKELILQPFHFAGYCLAFRPFRGPPLLGIHALRNHRRARLAARHDALRIAPGDAAGRFDEWNEDEVNVWRAFVEVHYRAGNHSPGRQPLAKETDNSPRPCNLLVRREGLAIRAVEPRGTRNQAPDRASRPPAALPPAVGFVAVDREDGRSQPLYLVDEVQGRLAGPRPLARVLIASRPANVPGKPAGAERLAGRDCPAVEKLMWHGPRPHRKSARAG